MEDNVNMFEALYEIARYPNEIKSVSNYVTISLLGRRNEVKEKNNKA